MTVQRLGWLFFGLLLCVPTRALEPIDQDLHAWYDATDDANFVLDGGRVTVWKDQSGAGHDLIQNVAARRPTRTNGVVVATAGQTLLAGGVTGSVSQMTVYAVVQTAPGYSPIISFRTDNQPEFCAAGWTIGARPTIFTAGASTDANCEVEDGQWHLLTFVRDGAARRFYVDGVPAGEPTGTDKPSAMTDLLLFAYSTAGYFTGSLAELRVYRTAHDARQVGEENSALLRKWARLFPDPASDLVVFVGNSLTTGMFCGNGQTWSRQAALQIPGLSRWYTICRGGITTPQLATLAGASVDGLLTRATGRKVLVFWEGTNDLVVNRATAAAAHDAIRQFCLARRQAGWDKVVVLTVLPRAAGPDFEARRLELNGLLRQNYREYAAALVDLDTVPEIGRPGCETNQTYFVDGVHLNKAGNALVAAVVAKTLQPLPH